MHELRHVRDIDQKNPLVAGLKNGRRYGKTRAGYRHFLKYSPGDCDRFEQYSQQIEVAEPRQIH